MNNHYNDVEEFFEIDQEKSMDLVRFEININYKENNHLIQNNTIILDECINHSTNLENIVEKDKCNFKGTFELKYDYTIEGNLNNKKEINQFGVWSFILSLNKIRLSISHESGDIHQSIDLLL